MSGIRLGAIGYGERARWMSQLMQQQDPEAKLVAIADPQGEAIQAKMAEDGVSAEGITFYDTADAMLDREPLDGVIVGTRCSLHAAMGLKVLNHGLALFLEKPIATTMEDLAALRAAPNAHKVVVSFPLRMSHMVKLAREIIDSGQIGKIEHVEAWNNVPYGSTYFQSWYRDEKETGGLFLQKATHDFDYINYLLENNRPVSVCAMTTKSVFKGNHAAGLRCMDCAERTTCFESPYHPSRPLPLALDKPAKEMCAFAVDTGNEDSGSALIEYESGIHASYTQNFVVRNKAGRRGAILIGYHGTIEFDWYTNSLKVYMHHEPRVVTHQFDEDGGHGGGDGVLASNFLKVIRGEEAPVSSLEDGMLSALLCLKARESALTRQFQAVAFPEAPTEDPVGNRDLAAAL
ncbi:4,5-dihydroxyphthalate dehydrogenase [Capsulimonas corticalis]|uniref:4,5-dihydroxyphthalate dehydrogenase n=1 Tax=Capsulimonas corticalis TaxID=2219043 RepID=A0A402CUL4_9BACT|nr:Gfo/Idh/MocA family oxidoreductase [Capsulimonas corticalis]BDI29019.1 4,5-dihydroxyphthalate dehydrogenase [Capsulimonas corticalis]